MVRSTRLAAGAAVVTGAVVVVLALVADIVGGGTSGYEFGWDQKIGVLIGASAVWFGCLALAGWRPRARRQLERSAEAADVAAATVQAS